MAESSRFSILPLVYFLLDLIISSNKSSGPYSLQRVSPSSHCSNAWVQSSALSRFKSNQAMTPTKLRKTFWRQKRPGDFFCNTEKETPKYLYHFMTFVIKCKGCVSFKKKNNSSITFFLFIDLNHYQRTEKIHIQSLLKLLYLKMQNIMLQLCTVMESEKCSVTVNITTY